MRRRNKATVIAVYPHWQVHTHEEKTPERLRESNEHTRIDDESTGSAPRRIVDNTEKRCDHVDDWQGNTKQKRPCFEMLERLDVV